MLATVGVVLTSIIAMLSGTAFLNRKNIQRLTAAQANETDAKATEVTDRIAVDWLTRLQSEIGKLEKEIGEVRKDLDSEVATRIKSVQFAMDLLLWINHHYSGPDPIPEVPAELSEYIRKG